ncbi:MAG: hypothetical protein MUW57_12000 [Pseudomonas sp.]|nr:hypothetical protein [Pseudomonas sp.]
MNNINLKVAEKIGSIARKPLSQRDMFILMRRVIRNSLRHKAQIRAERSIFRREAAKLKPFLPFAQRQMDMLIEKSKRHREDDLKVIEQGLVGFGYNLIRDAEGAYEAIGFSVMCDLLNINPVHRAEASQDAKTLADLIYVARLEDSVSPRSRAWGEGGPLFEACFLAMIEWIKTAPESDLPDLFGEGSPFSGAQVVQIKQETLQ